MPASSPRVQRGLGLAQREQQDPRSPQVGLEQLREEVSLEPQGSASPAPCPPRQEQSGPSGYEGLCLQQQDGLGASQTGFPEGH